MHVGVCLLLCELLGVACLECLCVLQVVCGRLLCYVCLVCAVVVKLLLCVVRFVLLFGL